MITSRSTKAELRAELDRVTAALARANRARADEFERWAQRCRGLKAQNEDLTREIGWLRDVANAAKSRAARAVDMTKG